MSLEYEVFVSKKLPITELKTCLENILNSEMEKVDVDWDLYRIRFLGLELCLYSAEMFVNDRELKFEEYDYCIDVDYIIGAVDNDLTDDWMKMASIVIGNIVSNALNCRCMVTSGVQILIRRFEPE